jgi:hypothetical protein
VVLTLSRRMYRIIAADGKPYGPVSAEQLRQWIREGRAGGRTQVQTGATTGWQPLASLPEFADVFGTASASPPPLTPSLVAAPPISPPPNPDVLVAEVLARNPRVRIGDCFSRGWNLICEQFWLSVGVGLVCILLTNVPLLIGPAYAGIFWFFLKRIRGEPVRFEDLFAPFSVAFVQCLLAGLVVSLLASVGFILCIIPGLVLMALWMFTWPLLMDKRLEFWPAMEVSRKVLWPNIWGAIGLSCVGLLLMILGLLCLYVGMFVAFPLIIAAEAYAYEDFFGHKNVARAAAVPTPAPARHL